MTLTAYLDNCKLSSVQSGITTDRREPAWLLQAGRLSEAKCRSATGRIKCMFSRGLNIV